MLEQQETEERSVEIRKLARELQYQSERCALAGLLEEATTILAQVWTMVQGHDADCANTAAWEAGWLWLRRQSYDEAAKWFSRVEALPLRESQLWPSARQALVQVCSHLAGGAAPPALISVLPSVREWEPLIDLSRSVLPQLRVKNLGRFKLVRAETVLPVCAAHKPIMLWRYLLSRRHRAAHKEELLELFWPDAQPRAATHSLQVAVTTLRHNLDPPMGSYLLFEAGHYTIHPDAWIEDDARHFEQYCEDGERCRRAGDFIQAQQSYTAALACYEGDYDVGDRTFAWAITEQERLLALYLSALDHLGQIFVIQRSFAAAVSCYQRLLERDGYREDVHCQLMRCYWQLGRRHEALEQYQRCASILTNDLGLEPMPETHALYLAISTQNVPADSVFT